MFLCMEVTGEMSPPEHDDWNEYRIAVIAELKRHTCELGKVQKSVTGLKVQVAMLMVKSGIWGVLGGMVPVVIMIVLWLITK